MSVEEENKYFNMTQEEKWEHRDAYAKKHGFKGMYDLEEQATDQPAGVLHVSDSWKAWENLTKEDIAAGADTAYDLSRISVRGEEEYQAKLQGRDLGEEEWQLEKMAEKM